MSNALRNDTDHALALKQAELWRDVERVLGDIEKKTGQVHGWVKERVLPLMFSDLPTDHWIALAALFRSIGDIRETLNRQRGGRRRRGGQ